MRKIAFTIVLNGMPFIKKQAEVIPQVFDEWHVIEGATHPTFDTAWCQHIDQKFYSDKKLSIDGTTEFLDSIADNNKIFVHRKNDFWNGKTEMCNVISDIMENCILMQIDVDEIWDIKILEDITNYAIANDDFDGMLFKCNYYVGPKLVIVSENTYGDKKDEWCRLWRLKDKSKWKTHEPPRIENLKKFLPKEFTRKKGWVFNHCAYVLEHQLVFKEHFYGYKNAVDKWKKLNKYSGFPCHLQFFFPWVDSDTIVDKIK